MNRPTTDAASARDALTPPHRQREEGHFNAARAVQAARFTLDKDVILSAATRTALDECLARLRFHHTIYRHWNFASVDPWA